MNSQSTVPGVWRLPGMAALAIATFFGAGGYYALLSVAPLWAAHGGAGPGGTGWVNGVLLLATVITQFLVPTMMDRWGTARVFAVGLALLGAPSPLMALSDSLEWILLCSAVRGVGFAILTVGGTSAAVQLAPLAMRGRAIGAWGLAVALPNLIVLPASLPMAEDIGFASVLWMGALPVLGIPAALALAKQSSLGRRTTPRTKIAPRAMLSVLRPTSVLFAVTVGGGAVLTFLPQVASAQVSAIALMLLGATGALTRWLAGGLADRGIIGAVLIPGLLTAALGLGMAAWAADRVGAGGSDLLFIAGAAVVGIAYGSVQNLTMVLALQRVQSDQVSMASAAWNVGFDLGTAVGSVLMGAVVAASDFKMGFLVMALIAVAAIPAALPSRAPAPVR